MSFLEAHNCTEFAAGEWLWYAPSTVTNTTVKENHELICRGSYALVRHPIYTGLLLAYIGTAQALWPTAGSLTLLAAFLLAGWIKSRQEEKLMESQFPDAYPAYRKKVRGGIIPHY